MLGIVSDSRSFQILMALHIPVFLILFQAGSTTRLNPGHLWKQTLIEFYKIQNQVKAQEQRLPFSGVSKLIITQEQVEMENQGSGVATTKIHGEFEDPGEGLIGATLHVDVRL